MKLSIIIATYNRPSMLSRVKKSLKNQLSSQVEVVIVEGVKGLSRARNLGWRQAKGEYIAYIDDDAIAEPDWVKQILRFIKQHPKVVAFGGPYTSSNAATLPSWIPLEVTSLKLHDESARPISLGAEWLTGTNMIFRKDILAELKGFDESLGVAGNHRAYGEETDLLIRMHNLGHEIWYDPNIKVQHEFAPTKQSLYAMLKDQFIHGYDSKDTFKNLKRSNPLRTAGTAVSRLKRNNLEWKTRIYFFLSPFAYLLGMISCRIVLWLKY